LSWLTHSSIAGGLSFFAFDPADIEPIRKVRMIGP
jgi:hypothetical protein